MRHWKKRPAPPNTEVELCMYNKREAVWMVPRANAPTRAGAHHNTPIACPPPPTLLHPPSNELVKRKKHTRTIAAAAATTTTATRGRRGLQEREMRNYTTWGSLPSLPLQTKISSSEIVTAAAYFSFIIHRLPDYVTNQPEIEEAEDDIYTSGPTKLKSQIKTDFPPHASGKKMCFKNTKVLSP